MDVFRRVRTEISIFEPVQRAKETKRANIFFEFSFCDLRLLQRFFPFPYPKFHYPDDSIDYVDLILQFSKFNNVFRLSTYRPLGGRRCSEIDLEEALQNYFLDIYRFNGRGAVEQRPSCPGADGNPPTAKNHSPVPTNAWEENFVNYMLYSDIVVIEQSPPSLESVMDLAKRGSGIAIGTYTGPDVAEGNPLLLLISVSTGIVIGGASVGVTRGLEVALENKIVDLFKDEKLRRR